MPLDSAEAFEAALKAVNFGQKVVAAAQTMAPVTPDRPRKAADFAPILVIVANDLLPIVDEIITDVED